jgi:hypothetical protein
MDAKRGPLDQLKACVGAKQQKGLTFLGYVLEAQKKVLEFELALLEDALRILKNATTPPAGS